MHRSKVDKLDEISTQKYRIWLEDNIVRAVWSRNTSVTFEDASATVDAVARVGEGRRLPLLVDTTEVIAITREARRCYSKSKEARAVALLVKSSLSRVLANFSVSLERPAFPLRVFDDEKEALNWLKAFLE